jgi:Wiskott-Aldrich syndrome protein
LETQEIDRIGGEMTIIYDRLKSTRSMTGREELTKMHGTKPNTRIGRRRKQLNHKNQNLLQK